MQKFITLTSLKVFFRELKRYIALAIRQQVSVTYSELVDLRNAGKLVAGRYYRITDYVTTVFSASGNERSAGHPFDVIVRAISENELSEHAYAAKHEGDDYFASANLKAWKIWYCLDNNLQKYAWADVENGKGIIYRMIDEWDNDCPYDFKNIQFKRFKVFDESPNGELADLDGTYIGTGAEMQGLSIDDRTFIWAYTFSLGDRLSEPIDASLLGYVNDGQGEGYGYKGYYGNNIILPCTCYQTIDDEQYSVYFLNNIVWFTNNIRYRSLISNNRVEGECINMTLSGHGTYINYDCRNIIMGDGCFGNILGTGCFLNTFGNSCGANTFGNDCWNNTFGNFVQNNTFGNIVQNNTFGNSCVKNTFGNDCDNNTFGNNCGGNTFGNNCDSNTFGNDCDSNTFGNNCRYNTFGNNCDSNTFGNFVQNNTFGNSCGNNTFGNGCYYNTFGNNCDSNTFGNDCDNNTFGNYVIQGTIGEGVKSLQINGGANDSSQIKDFIILNGTCSQNSSNKLIINFESNKKATQYAGLNSQGDLVIWCPADAV